MTFNELAHTLPNGFHDAELRNFTMDYVARTLTLDLEVWVGDFDEPDHRELYRAARVQCQDVALLVIESPDPSYDWNQREAIRFDTGEGVPPRSEASLPAAPAGTTITWMYLYEFNRFAFFAASSASLEWTQSEAKVRG